MIRQLNDVPANMVAFSAEGEVNEDDFKNTVFPAVEKLVAQTDKLNYLLVIDTPLKNFSAGAWLQDMLLGVKQLTKWERIAILSDSETLNSFTDMFSVLVPGEFKGFKKEEYALAVQWVSEGER